MSIIQKRGTDGESFYDSYDNWHLTPSLSTLYHVTTDLLTAAAAVNHKRSYNPRRKRTRICETISSENKGNKNFERQVSYTLCIPPSLIILLRYQLSTFSPYL